MHEERQSFAATLEHIQSKQSVRIVRVCVRVCFRNRRGSRPRVE
jgi:hypothetical protein